MKITKLFLFFIVVFLVIKVLFQQTAPMSELSMSLPSPQVAPISERPAESKSIELPVGSQIQPLLQVQSNSNRSTIGASLVSQPTAPPISLEKIGVPKFLSNVPIAEIKEKAVELRIKAKKGHAESARLLGLISWDPWDQHLNFPENSKTKRDEIIVLEDSSSYWFELGAKNGDLASAYLYASRLAVVDLRWYEKNNPSKAQELHEFVRKSVLLLKQAAEGGVTDAFFLMFHFRKNGFGPIPNSPAHAVACLLVVDQMNVDAAASLNVAQQLKNYTDGDRVAGQALAQDWRNCFAI